MRRSLNATALGVVLAAVSVTAQRIHPDEFKLKPEIDAAIANGVEHILDGQLRDGSWGVVGNHLGGNTGLCAYALLKCGVQMNHPGLRRAFGFLDSVTPKNTYAIACMMLAYGASGVPEHRSRMRQLLAILLRCQSKRGTWAYPHGGPDLSNTQYAALGLWAGSKAGLKVPPEVWFDLIAGTLKHQETFHLVDVKTTGRTGTDKREIAGFGYKPRKPKGPNNATGTMTTAGVSILKICEIGLGKKLRRKEREQLEYAMAAGLSWLDVYFSVSRDQRPGKRGGKWLLYYLYGMERVGGLTRLDQFGKHWWYLEGARVILKRQKKGSWGKHHDTCFALLFLRRATRGGPSTGAGSGGGKSHHLFSAGKKGDDILFHGAGQQPLILYITGFGELLLEEHAQYGLRILRVEYFEGRRNLGLLAADPTRAWNKIDTFVHRCPQLSHGMHTIEARVIAIAPDVASGDTTKTVTIKSLPMRVRIRDVMEPWMEGLAKLHLDNLLKDLKFDLKASSNPKQAKQAADGMMHTSWLCGAKDVTPTLTFEFPKSIKLRRLIMTQPLQRREDLKRVGVIQQVEVAFNKDKQFVAIEMSENPLAATEFELPKVRKVRKMTLRIVRRGGKAGLPVGFAEIVLAGKRYPK